jgi:glycosyltransferase involved in cell wall biosynthesis
MNAPSPLVSIITPTFNRAHLLPETLLSILAQDWTDFEYLVIDDGSTDGTEQVVRDCADPRVRYFRHDNAGESVSVNRGWGLARGRLIAVVSSDDPMMEGWLAASVEVMQRQPEVVVTYPDWSIIDATGAPQYTVTTYEHLLERMVAWFHATPGPGALIRRSAFRDDEALRSPRYRYAPDLDQWLRLGLRGPFQRIPHVLATWRNHAASITVSGRNHAYCNELLEIAAAFHERPEVPADIRALRTQTLSRAAYVASSVVADTAPWRADRLLRQSYALQPVDRPDLPAGLKRPPRPTAIRTVQAMFRQCASTARQLTRGTGR